MKKFYFIVLTAFISFQLAAQRDAVELTIQQPSQYLHVRLMHDKYHLISGQQFTTKITNITNKEIVVKGKITATTVCGNSKSSDFDVTIKPGATEGGHNFLDDATGMTGIIFPEECKKPQVLHPYPDKPNRTEKNRIRSLSISFSSIKFVEDSKKEIGKKKYDNNDTDNKDKEEKSTGTVSHDIRSGLTGNTREQQSATEKPTTEKTTSETYQDIFKNRADQVVKTDKAEDIAMGSAAAGIIAGASLMQDQFTNAPVYFKTQLGLGIDNIPLIVNSTPTAGLTNSSRTDASFHPIAYVGIRMGVFNNKGISFHLSPFFTYGMNALMPGANGSHLSYGGNATLFISTHNTSRIKLFAEGGYAARSGDYTYNLDAATTGTAYATSSGYEVSGSYDYSVMKYGGGVMLHWIGNENETYLKPGVFFEKPSFSDNKAKPVMNANLQLLISSFIIIDVSYSPNYPVPGSAKYTSNFKTEDKSYFSLKLIKTGIL